MLQVAAHAARRLEGALPGADACLLGLVLQLPEYLLSIAFGKRQTGADHLRR